MTPAEPSPRSLRGLVAVLATSAAALSANRMLAIAVPWFVLSTTGSAAKTGLVVFCQLGPYVVSQALSGPLIDRIGPKRISVVGDLISMTAMAVAPVLYLAGALPLGALAALMAVVGAADGPSNAAKSVFVPSVTRAARAPLERGTGLTGAVERTATTVGPAIAGAVIAGFGNVCALWVAAALFGLASVIVATTLHDPVPELHQPDVERVEGYLGQLRQGADFLRKEGLLRAIVAMVAVTNLLDQAFMAVLLPVWAMASGYGPEAVGLVVSVFGAASVVAALAAGRDGRPAAAPGRVSDRFRDRWRAPVRGDGARDPVVGGACGARRRRVRFGLHQPDHRRGDLRANPCRTVGAGQDPHPGAGLVRDPLRRAAGCRPGHGGRTVRRAVDRRRWLPGGCRAAGDAEGVVTDGTHVGGGERAAKRQHGRSTV